MIFSYFSYILSIILFFFLIIIFGLVLNRKNILITLMSIEILLLAINLNFAIFLIGYVNNFWIAFFINLFIITFVIEHSLTVLFLYLQIHKFLLYLRKIIINKVKKKKISLKSVLFFLRFLLIGLVYLISIIVGGLQPAECTSIQFTMKFLLKDYLEPMDIVCNIEDLDLNELEYNSRVINKVDQKNWVTFTEGTSSSTFKLEGCKISYDTDHVQNHRKPDQLLIQQFFEIKGKSIDGQDQTIRLIHISDQELDKIKVKFHD